MYGEDAIPEFKNNYVIEMYVKSFDGFQGEGDFLSKFGVQIRDNAVLSVARRIFSEEVGQYEALVRPREGDLIFFPLNGKLFEIKFVEHEPHFYQLGAQYFYDLKIELFEYSNERFNTGIKAIDDLEQNMTLDIAAFDIKTSNGYTIVTNDGFPIVQTQFNLETQAGDVFTDNEEIQTEGNTIINFSELDPFSDNGRW